MAKVVEITKMSVDRLGTDHGKKVPFRVWFACSECEREIPKDSNFCAYCGVKFNA